MKKEATKIVTEADAAAPSPNVIVEKVAAMTAEGDPELAALFRDRNEEGPQVDDGSGESKPGTAVVDGMVAAPVPTKDNGAGRALPRNKSNEFDEFQPREKWAMDMFLPGMPEKGLSSDEGDLLKRLYM